MPLYEVVLEQEYAGQQVINKWNFESSEIPTGVSGAFKAVVACGFAPDTGIEAFGEDTLAGKLQALQASFVTFVQVIARNIFDPVDYYTYAFPSGTTGANGSSQPMSPATSYSFATNRSRGDVARGQKRIVGVVEGNVNDLGLISSTALAVLQDFGDTMADIALAPTGGSAITYTPYVFGTFMYTEPPAKKAYRYYPDEVAQKAHNMRITQWTPKPQVRTQVSRQYGHGK